MLHYIGSRTSAVITTQRIVPSFKFLAVYNVLRSHCHSYLFHKQLEVWFSPLFLSLPSLSAHFTPVVFQAFVKLALDLYDILSLPAIKFCGVNNSIAECRMMLYIYIFQNLHQTTFSDVFLDLLLLLHPYFLITSSIVIFSCFN